jgi:hypothetical protein
MLSAFRKVNAFNSYVLMFWKVKDQFIYCNYLNLDNDDICSLLIEEYVNLQPLLLTGKTRGGQLTG